MLETLHRRRRLFLAAALTTFAACAPDSALELSADQGALTASNIQVSTSADRSSPVLLAGQSLSGVVHVFAAGANSKWQDVAFFVDDAAMAGTPHHVDGTAPFDLAGTAANGQANPFDTRTLADGSHSIGIRVRMHNGKYQSQTVSFTVSNSADPDPDPEPEPDPDPSTELSIFGPQVTPTVLTDPDTASVELGVKFRASVPGAITGIRFYKGSAANGGTHVGSLWSASGQKLASAPFTQETSSGWQTVRFAAPVSIAANTTYVASYFAPMGAYSASNGFFTGKGEVNGPLTALASGVDGPNGVYAYGSGGFPTQSYQDSNYFVDVLFVANSTQPGGDTTAPGAPPSLTANATSATSIALAWSSASDNVGVTGYQIFRGTTLVATVSGDTLAFTDTGLSPSTTYSYTVRAQDGAGNIGPASAPASATTQAGTPAPATGVYQVKGRFLHDPCGEKLIVRGVEQVFWNPWLSPNGEFIAQIAKTGANTVRLLPHITQNSTLPAGTTPLTLAQVENLIQLSISHGMMVDIALDGGGSVDIYLRSDVKALLQKYEKHLVLHAMGEGTQSTASAWASDSIAGISKLRAAGYKAPIYVMSNTYGRNLPTLLSHGQQVFDSDPLKNVVFGWQAYWSGTYYQSQYGMSLHEAFAKVRDAAFPIQAGIMGVTDPWSNSLAMDYSLAMADSQAWEIGWLWWDWRLSGAHTSLTTDGTYGNWQSPWGADVVINNANSLQKTSKKTAFLQNGTCAPGTGTGSGDTTAPTAAFGAPASGATVSGTVTVTGTAADDVGVTGVQLRIGSAAWQPATGTTSWSFAFDTTKLANGSHTLTVQATDAAGNTGTATRMFNVSNTSTPTQPGGSLNLPRVPWEGGPAYYKQFPAAVALGWDQPTFFPIGVWYEGVYTQSEVDLDKDVGINTYVALTAPTNMSLVRQNGMSVVSSHGENPGWGSETVGWNLADEPDMIYGPGWDAWSGNWGWNTCSPIQDQGGRCGYTVQQTLLDAAPKNGRFMYSNYGKGVMLWETDTQAATFVNTFTSVASNDIYWYTDPNICGEMQTFLGLPSSTCRLAANYGVTMDKMRRLDGLDGKRQPIFNFIEVGHPFSENWAPTITPDQAAGAVMNSLIHEARGILYFNHSFGGSCVTQHALREPCYSAVRAKVKETNQRIKALAPVLNTQSYAHTFNANLDTMLKEYNGSFYIFAMVGRAKAPGAYTLTLPAGMGGTTVEVLNENRTLNISNGTFSDTFAAEYSYHIYKITP